MVIEPETEQMSRMQQTKSITWTSGWPQTPLEFEALIEVFQDHLVRYAFCKLNDLHDAEDAVQEVFLKAFVRRNELKKVSPVAPYLYRMVANMCIDRLRRRKPVIVSIEEIGTDEIPHENSVSCEQASAAEQLKLIEKVLKLIPEKQADVLRLRFINELSLSDISIALGCSVNTIKSRLRYGITSIRNFLSKGKEKSL